MNDKVTDRKRYCAVCVNRGRTEKDRDAGGIMHCRVYNLIGEKICIEKGYVSFERDSQAQEAPKAESAACAQDMRLMQGAMDEQTEALAIKALQEAIWIIDKISTGKESTKAIDLIKRVKVALETGELKIEPPCQAAPKAASQSAEELALEIIDNLGTWGLSDLIEHIEADRAAQRSLGAEDMASVYGDNLDRLEKCYAEVVEAARGISKEWAILPSEMKYDLLSVKTWLIRYMGVQIKALNKALADLDAAQGVER